MSLLKASFERWSISIVRIADKYGFRAINKSVDTAIGIDELGDQGKDRCQVILQCKCCCWFCFQRLILSCPRPDYIYPSSKYAWLAQCSVSGQSKHIINQTDPETSPYLPMIRLFPASRHLSASNNLKNPIYLPRWALVIAPVTVLPSYRGPVFSSLLLVSEISILHSTACKRKIQEGLLNNSTLI